MNNHELTVMLIKYYPMMNPKSILQHKWYLKHIQPNHIRLMLTNVKVNIKVIEVILIKHF